MSNAHHPPRSRFRWIAAVASLGGVALLAACGSSAANGTAGSSASSPTATSSASASSSPSISCTQISLLRTSLTRFSHVTVSANSAGQISADLTSIETEFAALENQAAGAYSAEIGQLTTALNQITKSAQALAKHPSQANLTATTNAVNNLKATAKPLIKEMQTVCPSS
jgi:hypothetical protein